MCTPGRRKKIGGQIYRGKVVVHPPGRARVHFLKQIGKIWTVGVVNLVVSACVLRTTTKEKGHQIFRGRKVHLREYPGYANGCDLVIVSAK